MNHVPKIIFINFTLSLLKEILFINLVCLLSQNGIFTGGLVNLLIFDVKVVKLTCLHNWKVQALFMCNQC